MNECLKEAEALWFEANVLLQDNVPEPLCKAKVVSSSWSRRVSGIYNTAKNRGCPPDNTMNKLLIKLHIMNSKVYNSRPLVSVTYIHTFLNPWIKKSDIYICFIISWCFGGLCRQSCRSFAVQLCYFRS